MFPYIKQISVLDCFSSKGIAIPKVPLTEFRHIILTGNNGSGKTTILNRIALQLAILRHGQYINDELGNLKAWTKNKQDSRYKVWMERIVDLESIKLSVLGDAHDPLRDGSDAYVFAHFKANRQVALLQVNSVTKESEFEAAMNDSHNPENVATLLKQFLVNKKIYAAFELLEGNREIQNEGQKFFSLIEDLVRNIMNDNNAKLVFTQREFEFYIHLSNGQVFSLNQMSAGFSAFLAIAMELLIRIDVLKRNHNDYQLDPFGIVILDEPETHLHLRLQYEILPILTTLFPKIQFIVATHSPAVISSVKDSVVFDLTSNQELTDQAIGSSFSSLMISHFGLDNEFSDTADDILAKVNQAVQNNNVELLNVVLSENDKYLSPSLRLEIESQIIRLKSKND